MGQSLPFLPVALSWLEPLVPVPMLPLREVVVFPLAGRTQSVPLSVLPPSADFAPGSSCGSTSGNLGSSPIRRDILVLPLVVLDQPFASTSSILLPERVVAVLPGPQPVQDCSPLATGPLPSSPSDNHFHLLHRHRHLRRHHLGLVLQHSLRRFACRS